ncbi:uncharacterized protein BDW43DRAFT_307685 [Aspergillus alliaceus]|uniref:uncharacterized protein n=1 Tax=Petromyces alliaceus TaxID=209559 RepID=UPI0012A55B27|nr:uncharacterized protein BDW43DRAFT_307685 [Aspergillus alliaceus]KAB8237410.1 hypothetical protein BDW43DRAFT_307685 [Aspergillus alliaceus]
MAAVVDNFEGPPAPPPGKPGGGYWPNPPPDRQQQKRKHKHKPCGRCGKDDRTRDEHDERTYMNAIEVLVSNTLDCAESLSEQADTMVERVLWKRQSSDRHTSCPPTYQVAPAAVKGEGRKNRRVDVRLPQERRRRRRQQQQVEQHLALTSQTLDQGVNMPLQLAPQPQPQPHVHQQGGGDSGPAPATQGATPAPNHGGQTPW